MHAFISLQKTWQDCGPQLGTVGLRNKGASGAPLTFGVPCYWGACRLPSEHRCQLHLQCFHPFHVSVDLRGDFIGSTSVYPQYFDQNRRHFPLIFFLSICFLNPSILFSSYFLACTHFIVLFLFLRSELIEIWGCFLHLSAIRHSSLKITCKASPHLFFTLITLGQFI